MKYPSRLRLANLPTKVERLQRAWGKGQAEVYIKRDDLTGCVLSGNKVRKLEFIFADVLEKGCDTVITCGGVQSNHARTTAFVAARLGLKSALVLRGEPPAEYDGNLFLDMLAGADSIFISEEEYEKIDEVMEDRKEELKLTGYRPYIIPEGASNELGVFGYIKAMEEMKDEVQSIGIDAIITACGSGGTYAGLLLGKKLFGVSAKIYGINVCKTAEYFVEKIYRLCRETIEKCNLGVKICQEEIEIIDGYVGEGYARSRPEEISLIKRMAQLEGIVLDPVYTGKAMFGLLEEIEKGRFREGEKILFLHTGGIFGLFSRGLMPR